ncbi:MAG: nuclear transport factor 2 family protein [Sphingomonadaceae bacterium]|nr:nuclear transport factor 2 family protein [Sphingomonadaceae bacterium]
MRWMIAAAALLPVAAVPQTPPPTSVEAELTTLDARQKEMVARADVSALAALAAPTLTINAPINRVLRRDQFLDMMRSGQIGAEAFTRTVESVTVTGDVGIVMGSEVFTPTATSELGRTYGARPLQRRYTNVYVRTDSGWKWLARHANVVDRLPG